MDPETDVESVNGPDAQSGEETSVQPESTGSERTQPASGTEENRIPHSRVREMIRQEREKALREFQEKEYGPLKKNYEDLNQRMMQAELARLEKMGWYQPEQPKPVTQDDIEKMFLERDRKIEEKQLQLYHEQHIGSAMPAVKAKYPLLAKKQGFMELILTRYASNPRVSFIDHADAVAQEFDGYYSEREAEAARKREETTRPDRRVMPSGRGAASGSAKSGGGKPKTVGEKLLAKMREQKGE